MKKARYSLQDTPFHRLRSKSRLAKILCVPLKLLCSLTEGENRYRKFSKKKKSGGVRLICDPVPSLKKIQTRIKNLFDRVAIPDFLFSAVSGRSHIDNAACHVGAHNIYSLDIQNFFPNCTIKKALWFFQQRLGCSPDVATILAKIITFEDELPHGSPCSPILAYFIYIDMWEEIDKLVNEHKCTLSVYVDDIAISGAVVPKELIWKIKKVITRHGHSYSKAKEKSWHRKKADITGVIVGIDGVSVPNRQRFKLYTARKDLLKANTDKQKKEIKAQIQGRCAQINQIIKTNLKIIQNPN